MKTISQMIVCLIVTLVIWIPWRALDFVLNRIVDLLKGLTIMVQGLINLMEEGKHQIYLKVIRPALYDSDERMGHG